MKRRKKYAKCAVERLRNGKVRFRFRWKGKRYSRTTKHPIHTPEDRAAVDRQLIRIGAAIRAGDNPLALFKRAKEPTAAPKSETVREYYERWIADKAPPLVRRAQARDLRSHIRGYVLPRLGNVPIAELSSRDILGLRSELLERGLSLKYAKNILAGSLRAMIRDARTIDHVIERDPFGGVRWPPVEVPGPDPFTIEEMNRILDWFARRRFGFHAGRASGGPRLHAHPPFHAFVHTLFKTGMRPSEAAALRWGDVDLEMASIRVARSRYLGEESAPKNAKARRTVRLLPDTVKLLRSIQPLHVTPEMLVFRNTEGRPIDPRHFPYWYDCLRALGIRQRGLYSTKDSYISSALTAGVNPTWLEEQTGVRYETMRRHYGRWLVGHDAEELRKLANLAPALAPVGTQREEVIEKAAE
jgi:integrase